MAGKLKTYVTAEIRQVPGPTGIPVCELFQNVKIKSPVGHGGTQAPFLINRPWTIGDVTDLYVTYWFKHQANLLMQLDTTTQLDGSVGNWRTLYEFKTGGRTHPVTGLKYYGGDYRITTLVMKGNGSQLFWRTHADDGANYVVADSVGTVHACPDAYCPLNTYWTDDNHTVPVPIDTWFKVEGYWHRSSGSDGRYWVAVNGQIIADHHGPIMGLDNLPITRIFIDNPYSGGHAPVETHLTGLELWDGFPCGDGVPCYK